MSIKSEMRAGSVTQTAVLVQLKRYDLAVAVDKTHCYSYSVSGLLECMHFSVFSISQSILPE
jgi:hypothetical protein